MAIIEQERHITWDRDGHLVADETVEIDVTEAVVEWTLHDQARQALAANRTFLATATPTNAQTLAQVRRLTEQMQRVIRLVLGEFDGTD